MTKSDTITVTTPSDREVTVTRMFDAPRKLVFEACTDPKLIPRWMLGPEGWTMPVCEIDLRVGGSYHYVWRKADGAEMAMSGTYREVKPPERVVNTESWGPGWPETINTLVLTEKAGRTTMTMTILFPSKEARDAATKTGMMKGMSLSYDRLDALLVERSGS